MGLFSSVGSIVGGLAGGLITGGSPLGIMAGAGIGGSLGGGIDSERSQHSALKRQSRIANAQLAFNEQQYNDWKNVFGPIEENLAEHFSQLDPESYASHIKDSLSNYFNQAKTQLNRTLAQRGLTDSGLSFEASKDLNQELARQKALADQQANDIVERKKLSFLGLGLGNQGALLGNINNSYGNQMNLAGERLQLANQQGLMANQSLAGATQAAMYMYGRGMFGNTPSTVQPYTGGYDFNKWALIK